MQLQDATNGFDMSIGALYLHDEIRKQFRKTIHADCDFNQNMAHDTWIQYIHRSPIIWREA